MHEFVSIFVRNLAYLSITSFANTGTYIQGHEPSDKHWVESGCKANGMWSSGLKQKLKISVGWMKD